jgi:hypothetical protein
MGNETPTTREAMTPDELLSRIFDVIGTSITLLGQAMEPARQVAKVMGMEPGETLPAGTLEEMRAVVSDLKRCTDSIANALVEIDAGLVAVMAQREDEDEDETDVSWRSRGEQSVIDQYHVQEADVRDRQEAEGRGIYRDDDDT